MRSTGRQATFSPDSAIGQHILLDADALNHTTSLVPPGAHCVEIGPGPGALTKKLLANNNSVKAYEIDQRCRPFLERLALRGNLDVQWGDFLKTPNEDVNQQLPYHLVGNIPYNISEPLLKKMTSLFFDSAVLLVGKRMSQAVTAAHPDDKSWTRMSMISQGYFTSSIVRHVPRESFDPPPRTESALIVQHRKDADDVWQSDAITQAYRALFEAGIRNTTAACALKSVVIDAEGMTVAKSSRKTRASRTNGRQSDIELHQPIVASSDLPTTSEQITTQTLLSAVDRRIDASILSKPLSGINNNDLRRLCYALNKIINDRKQ